MLRVVALLTLCALPALADPEAPPEPSPSAVEAAAQAGGEAGLLSRIDFGNAYVMGQSIKSGAVYLLNRKKSEIPSMLQVRRDFRNEIRQGVEVLGSE
jgi:hypothetical protein